MKGLNRLLVSTLIVGMLASCNNPTANQLSEQITEIDFNHHIKPILSDRCFACHGPDKNTREAGLRLDTPEGALEHLLESGSKAFVPGNRSQSEAFQRMVSDDPNEIMTPPESKLQLTADEIALLGRWIDQGAEYKPHWAYIPPSFSELPEIAQEDWIHNPIDRFVLNKLESLGWSPSSLASPTTLARRMSFSLTGLPPKQEDLKILKETDNHALANYLDKLLASPAYGERMAAYWLDMARYADSDGYLDDKHRDFTPWRDWVIQAFNDNMPYDQFVTWQLAGDLMESPSQDQVLATAFNRLHKKNSEAGIVFEEYRLEYVADRTNTFGKAMLGLTLECARCHDHKYDPISQKEYFELFSFFNSTNELGTAVYGPDQTPGPALMLASDQVAERRAFLQQAISEQENKLRLYRKQLRENIDKDHLGSLSRNQLKEGLEQAQQAYYSFDRIIPHSDKTFTTANLVDSNQPIKLTNPIHKAGVSGKALFVSEYHAIKTTGEVGKFERTDPFSVSLWLRPDTLYDEAGIFYHCEDLRLGYKGYTLNLDKNHLQFIIAHSWPQNALQVTSSAALPPQEWSHVVITYDGSSKAQGINLYINGDLADIQIDYDNLYKGIIYEPDIHTYGFDGFYMGYRDKIPVFRNGGLDELRIFTRDITPLEVAYLYQPQQWNQLLTDPAYASLIETHHIKRELAQTTALSDSLQLLREQENILVNEIPEIMVMGDLPDPRPTFLLDRGDYRSPSEQVYPNTPEVLRSFSENYPQNRLGLSQWLFDPKHPLTARVMVNRVWQMHFGRGLVNSSDDFGSQGDLPTHPELLDWLALYFIESGWDLKALHKLILSSATYQQQSVIDPLIHEEDPDNIYLSRGPRFRMPAEMVRDNALAMSGLLVEKIGGSSQYPYQPEGLWDEISNKVWRYRYDQAEGEGLYRRSLYTIWKRTAPPPSMLIFDIADRDVCTVKRTTTQTPLQALVLMNDVQYIEAARALTTRVFHESGEDNAKRLAYGFELILGRMPKANELSLIQRQYQEEKAYYQTNPDKAQAYLSTGKFAPDDTLAQEELAAMSVVVHSIMNTNEAITIQ